MKIWLTVMINNSEPTQKVYLVGAHSTEAAAKSQASELEQSSGNHLEILNMHVDDKQPPILVGVANTSLGSDCKKNTPNG